MQPPLHSIKLLSRDLLQFPTNFLWTSYHFSYYLVARLNLEPTTLVRLSNSPSYYFEAEQLKFPPSKNNNRSSYNASAKIHLYLELPDKGLSFKI